MGPFVSYTNTTDDFDGALLNFRPILKLGALVGWGPLGDPEDTSSPRKSLERRLHYSFHCLMTVMLSIALSL